jgi:dihydropteroate synthase
MYVAMHSRGRSDTMGGLAEYADVVTDVRRELELRLSVLLGAGVSADRVVIDPGIGFAKTAAHNWRLLGALGEFVAMGHPVLVGDSRKRFLADLLPEGTGAVARDGATAVVSALAAEAGVWGVRVHDVAATATALDVWGAMRGLRS